MLMTLTCTGSAAGDLGYLLHKNPASHFEKELSFGIARVFYPEASAERCTAALLVEVDPVGGVRSKGPAPAVLAHYVSDRPYVASSFLSVAIAECFGTALGGRSRERPDRVTQPLPLSATLYAVACDGGPALVRRLFEPLGYAVEIDDEAPLLDERFPEWGAGRLYRVSIHGDQTVQALLTHLYVLIPVLDDAKHYRFGEDEVEKLVRRGEGWLGGHPERELIARRYLRHRRPLADAALARLDEIEDRVEVLAGVDPDAEPEPESAAGPVSLRLNERRIASVLDAVRATAPAARRVIDLGCAEGRTLAALHRMTPPLEHVAGMDVSAMQLERAGRHLRLERMGERERARLSLFSGSLVYRDARLAGYDVALLQEVIEHLDPDRLESLERVVFAHARPRRVIVTTPNAEYNSVWPSLPAGSYRHPDHRFEWSRRQFADWAERIAERYGYAADFAGIGDEDPEGRGTPTQMALFDLR